MKGKMTQKVKEALERFKMESASEVGVTLNNGYNGDLASPPVRPVLSAVRWST